MSLGSPGPRCTIHLLEADRHRNYVEVDGLIDTGADSTCFEESVLLAMGYEPVGEVEIEGATDKKKCPVFYAAFDLPDHSPVYRVEMKIVGLPSLGNKMPSLGLVGRDLLELGDFRFNREGYSLQLRPHTSRTVNVQAIQAYRAAMGGQMPLLGTMAMPPGWRDVQALAAAR